MFFMFVVINNKGKNPIEIEGDIQRTRNNGEITPAFAMEILSLTNFRSNIKKLVRAIKDKNKTKEEILPYKKFIVSCVDSREISEEALADLQEMATLCGCEKEFEVANGKAKFYGKFDCNNTDTKVVKSNEKFKALKGEDLTVYFDADKVELSYSDLSKIKALKFKEGARIDLRGDSNLPKGLDVSMCSKVYLGLCDLSKIKGIKFKKAAVVDLSEAYNLPKDLDFSQCSHVDLCKAKNLPEVLDFSQCSSVNLGGCDLTGVKVLKFREGAEVDLSNAKNLPKDLDVSMCSWVDLHGCDLEGLNLKFREGAVADLKYAKNLPKDLDVSMCSWVGLHGCDLEGLNLKFREGARVYLEGAYNLPKDLDFSMCPRVDLQGCDLEGLNLKFKEGAEVDLEGTRNLPEVLDVSMCSWVDLRYRDLSGVKELKFRDRVCLLGAKNLPEVLDLSMCSYVDLRYCDLSGVKKIIFNGKKQEMEFMKNEFMYNAEYFEGKFVYEMKKENVCEKKKEKEDNSLFSRIRKRFGAGGMG